jgi:hypothetical protein
MAWLTGWTYRKQITIDHLQVSEDLSYFPVLISISGDTDIGSHALSSGNDIRITSYDETTVLDYEIESFLIAGGSCTTVIWAKIPYISSSSDTVLYIYYGNSGATDAQNASGVWDDGGNDYFAGVWHLAESGTGTAADYKDSTANNNDSANTTNQPTRSSGKFGYGQTFIDDYIETNNTILDGATEGTFSAWINPTTIGGNNFAGIRNTIFGKPT